MGERLQPHVSGLVVRQKSNGRAVYDKVAKRALVEAALQSGVSVARLALDHAVNGNLLRKCIRLYQTPPEQSRPSNHRQRGSVVADQPHTSDLSLRRS